MVFYMKRREINNSRLFWERYEKIFNISSDNCGAAGMRMAQLSKGNGPGQL
jgi:hypothetical protein